ncbi:MAG: cation:proton antiporter [Candidatus Eisenbacteria bacterium]|nr:cation:proton antiporter [Candidatus Eisenbacteria bacterium]
MTFSPEIGYVGVLFALFVIPRALQRFAVPPAITSLALGVAAGIGFGLYQHDTTIHLLSAFGISALFLFAGLEVDVRELRANAGVLSQHLAVRTALLAGVAFAVARLLELEPRAATLLALGLLTPSTGFILDSIGQFGLADVEKRWVKAKAIATELLALLVMFAALQSTTIERFAVSTVVLLGMIALLPLLFRAFASVVVPFAPRSEFAFLLMMAVVCSFVTRELGVYYLVGAFVVGMSAQRFRERLPAIASEQMIHAVEMFASFFVPFYFLGAGLQLRREDLSVGALAYGAVFLASMVPLRAGAVVLHRWLALHESPRTGLRVAVAMLPTLVFGLVIAEILRDRFGVRAEIFGGVILYTIVTTMLPSFFLRRPLPDGFELHAPAVGPGPEVGRS